MKKQEVEMIKAQHDLTRGVKIKAGGGSTTKRIALQRNGGSEGEKSEKFF